jgi:hypothetical protein
VCALPRSALYVYTAPVGRRLTCCCLTQPAPPASNHPWRCFKFDPPPLHPPPARLHACCLQIFVSIPACINLLEGPYIETHEAVVKAFRPPALVRKQKPAAAAAEGEGGAAAAAGAAT